MGSGGGGKKTSSHSGGRSRSSEKNNAYIEGIGMADGVELAGEAGEQEVLW